MAFERIKRALSTLEAQETVGVDQVLGLFLEACVDVKQNYGTAVPNCEIFDREDFLDHLIWFGNLFSRIWENKERETASSAETSELHDLRAEIAEAEKVLRAKQQAAQTLREARASLEERETSLRNEEEALRREQLEQAERRQRFEETQKQCERLKKELAQLKTFDCEGLQAQLEALSRTHRQLSEQQQSEQEQYRRLTGEVEQLRQALEAQRGQNRHLRDQIAADNAEKETLQQSYTHLTEELCRLRQALADCNGQTAKQQAENLRLREGPLAEAKQRLAQAEEEARSLTEQREQAESIRDQILSDRAAVEKQLLELETLCVHLREEQDTLSERLRAAQTQKASLEQTLTERKSEFDQLKGAAASIVAETESRERNNVYFRDHQLAAAQSAFQDAKASFEAMQRDVAQLEAQSAHFHAETGQLNRKREQLEGETDALKYEWDLARQKLERQQADCCSLQQEKAALHERGAAVQEELTELRQQNNHLEQELLDKTEERRELAERIQSAKQKTATLEETIQSQIQEEQKLRAEVSERRKKSQSLQTALTGMDAEKKTLERKSEELRREWEEIRREFESSDFEAAKHQLEENQNRLAYVKRQRDQLYRGSKVMHEYRKDIEIFDATEELKNTARAIREQLDELAGKLRGYEESVKGKLI